MEPLKRRRFLEILTASAAATFLSDTFRATAAMLPKYQWVKKTANAPWHQRDGAGLLWFKGRLFILGGWDGAPYPYPNPANPSKPIYEGVPAWNRQRTTNEVWFSFDGKTWTLALAHSSKPTTVGPNARWRPRHTAGWIVHKN